MAAPQPTRMTRTGITDSVTFAHTQLKRARQDGGCEQIVFWTRRIDQLLDELAELDAQP